MSQSSVAVMMELIHTRVKQWRAFSTGACVQCNDCTTLEQCDARGNTVQYDCKCQMYRCGAGRQAAANTRALIFIRGLVGSGLRRGLKNWKFLMMQGFKHNKQPRTVIITHTHKQNNNHL